MAKKETPYLDFYFRHMKNGVLPSNGLCTCFTHHKLFKLIDPDMGQCLSYWGFDDDPSAMSVFDGGEVTRWYSFTQLRQNVVLLMAAMNNEL